MKPCAHCQTSPHWHYCRNVSRKRGADHYLIEGCRHSEAFAQPFSFIPAAEREAFVAKWDAEAERLFAAYTARWTEPARVSFRVRLFGEPVATELPLVTPEQIEATKAVVATHRTSGPDEDP